MLRVTKDIVLPTTITGSLPRPSWYTVNQGPRSFLDAMVNSVFREQYTDAVARRISPIRNSPGSTSSPTVTRISTRRSAGRAGRTIPPAT